ncbi:hypothetical protein Barb7_02819 [Bacteroidales bacterium Barb7]|nr:hypothetical protein Barb7_02819 [Bacteroidales bacterium Barb7]
MTGKEHTDEIGERTGLSANLRVGGSPPPLRRMLQAERTVKRKPALRIPHPQKE